MSRFLHQAWICTKGKCKYVGFTINVWGSRKRPIISHKHNSFPGKIQTFLQLDIIQNSVAIKVYCILPYTLLWTGRKTNYLFWIEFPLIIIFEPNARTDLENKNFSWCNACIIYGGRWREARDENIYKSFTPQRWKQWGAAIGIYNVLIFRLKNDSRCVRAICHKSVLIFSDKWSWGSFNADVSTMLQNRWTGWLGHMSWTVPILSMTIQGGMPKVAGRQDYL